MITPPGSHVDMIDKNSPRKKSRGYPAWQTFALRDDENHHLVRWFFPKKKGVSSIVICTWWLIPRIVSGLQPWLQPWLDGHNIWESSFIVDLPIENGVYNSYCFPLLFVDKTQGPILEISHPDLKASTMWPNCPMRSLAWHRRVKM